MAQQDGATYKPNNKYVFENQLIACEVWSNRNATAMAVSNAQADDNIITDAARINCFMYCTPRGPVGRQSHSYVVTDSAKV